MLKTILRSHQIEAVEKAKPHDGFILLGEQRTGKTLTALALVEYHKPEMLLIVCPTNAIRVWKHQIAEHLEIDWEMQIEVVNFEFLSFKDDRRKKFYKWADQWKGQRFMIICDEAHKIKKRGSKQSRALRVLGKRARWRLALTGTPIDKSLDQAWAIMNFVLPEVFGTFDIFANRYLIMGGFKGKKIVGHQRLDEFQATLHRYCQRITLREARELPLRIRTSRIRVQLSEPCRELYDALRDRMRGELPDGTTVKVNLAITQAAKLQELTSGFIKIGEQGFKEGRIRRICNEKLLHLANVLVYRVCGEKSVVVCRFIEDLIQVEIECKLLELTFKTIRGGHPFDGSFDTDVVILQIQAGMAFDLSAADHLIFFSLNHSHLDHDQARSRILNYTKRQVSYYYLIAEDTVDEALYSSCIEKKKFSTALLDHYRRYARKRRKQL